MSFFSGPDSNLGVYTATINGKTITKRLPKNLSDEEVRRAFAEDYAAANMNAKMAPVKGGLFGSGKRRQDGLRASPDTLESKLTGAGRNALSAMGMDPREAHRLSSKTFGFLNDLTPVGDAVSADDARAAWNRGDYLAAAGNAGLAAIGAIPGAGDAAASAAKTMARSAPTLDFPSQLNRPRNPTLEEMQRFSSLVDVPLAQARLGNKLQWDQFGKVSPLLDEYADNPIAAQLENGEYVLVDGNHRTARALQEGRQTMPMHVIQARQYDPQNMGRKPKWPSAEEIDRLLDELNRP